MDRQSVILLLLIVLGIFIANWRTFLFLFSLFSNLNFQDPIQFSSVQFNNSIQQFKFQFIFNFQFFNFHVQVQCSKKSHFCFFLIANPWIPSGRLILNPAGYDLFNFTFDLLHLAAIELAITGFFRESLFSTTHRHHNKQHHKKGRSAHHDSHDSHEGDVNEEAAGAAVKTVGEEKTVVNVESQQIDKTAAPRPSGEFPVHEVYGPLAREMLESFLQLTEQTGDWVPKFENSDVKIFTSSSSENRFKFQFALNNTPLTCFDLLNNVNRRLEWDSMVAEAKIVEQIDPNTTIYHLRGKAMFPVASRDSVIFSFKTSLPGGRLVNVIKSIDHPSYPADPSGTVIRAESGLSGMICSEVEGNIKKTQVLQISNLDPKGWIPAQVKNFGKNTKF